MAFSAIANYSVIDDGQGKDMIIEVSEMNGSGGSIGGLSFDSAEVAALNSALIAAGCDAFGPRPVVGSAIAQDSGVMVPGACQYDPFTDAIYIVLSNPVTETPSLTIKAQLSIRREP